MNAGNGTGAGTLSAGSGTGSGTGGGTGGKETGADRAGHWSMAFEDPLAPAHAPTRPVGVVVVTGTGTEIGKTVVTAALATLARAEGRTVAVVKPAQTGVGEAEPGDCDEVRRLAQIDEVYELSRFPDPLAPATAARVSGLPAPALRDVARRLGELEHEYDLVLVEGSGGLLVRFDANGWTIADLAVAVDAPALVVTRPDLGTLNHTALTVEALHHRGVDIAGVVIGSWPRTPDLACRTNLADLEDVVGARLSGALPAGAGTLSPDEFLAVAHRGLAPELGGAFDPDAFRTALDLEAHQ